MRNFVSECIQNRNTLENIQCELEIAHETKRFVSPNTFEIRTDSKKLLDRLEEIIQRSETTKKRYWKNNKADLGRKINWR